MSGNNTILEFQKPKTERLPDGIETAHKASRPGVQIRNQKELPTYRVDGSTVLAPIPIDTLYSAVETEGTKPSDLFKALQLLADAISSVTTARDLLRQNDLLESDKYIQGLQGTLPELFRCRNIGDGFGAIVNAIEISFVNQNGKPFEEKQINLLLRILKQLRSAPFISFDSAQNLITELESLGFDVYPATLDAFSDDEP